MSTYHVTEIVLRSYVLFINCLLYTSDAADDYLEV